MMRGSVVRRALVTTIALGVVAAPTWAAAADESASAPVRKNRLVAFSSCANLLPGFALTPLRGRNLSADHLSSIEICVTGR